MGEVSRKNLIQLRFCVIKDRFKPGFTKRKIIFAVAHSLNGFKKFIPSICLLNEAARAPVLAKSAMRSAVGKRVHKRKRVVAPLVSDPAGHQCRSDPAD